MTQLNVAKTSLAPHLVPVSSVRHCSAARAASWTVSNDTSPVVRCLGNPKTPSPPSNVVVKAAAAACSFYFTFPVSFSCGYGLGALNQPPSLCSYMCLCNYIDIFTIRGHSFLPAGTYYTEPTRTTGFKVVDESSNAGLH